MDNLPQHPVKSRFTLERLDPVLKVLFGQNLFQTTSLRAALPLSQDLPLKMRQVQRMIAAESTPVLITQYPTDSRFPLPREDWNRIAVF